MDLSSRWVSVEVKKKGCDGSVTKVGSIADVIICVHANLNRHHN